MRRLSSLFARTVSARLSSLLSLTFTGFLISLSYGADDTASNERSDGASKVTPEQEQPQVDKDARVSIAVARDRAALLHQVYTTTLEVMHHRYFHADRSVVPARAMEDVFENLEDHTGSEAKWISVNLRAMSINHEPETDFEKQAARELGKGQAEYTVVQDGIYRRATPILLHGGCVSCHAGFNPKPSKTPKLAGLIISMPVMEEEAVQP